MLPLIQVRTAQEFTRLIDTNATGSVESDTVHNNTRPTLVLNKVIKL